MAVLNWTSPIGVMVFKFLLVASRSNAYILKPKTPTNIKFSEYDVSNDTGQ